MQAIKETAQECQLKSNVFTLNFIFTGLKMSVSNRLELFLIDIEEIFPIQSSIFRKLLYFGSNKKKLQQSSNKNSL